MLKPALLPVFFVILWSGCVLSKVYFAKNAPHVQLPNNELLLGSLKHSRDGRPYSAFMGISYAVVPERFQASRLLKESWKGTKNCTTPGNICPQHFLGKINADVIGHEDCLNLNVYVPKISKKTVSKLPVMVWLHGGGFLFGDGIGYGPKYFMDEDVILVTLNYRLGVFGFLSTGDDVVPGNNGLKDIVIALQWVRYNIRAFGGDNDKVTIFGESAGGTAVHYLILSPLAKGLFHRGIAQSGSALCPWAYNPKPREYAVQLAMYLKCGGKGGNPEEISSEEILACLKSFSTEEITKAQMNFKFSWPDNMFSTHFVPTAEPESTAGAFLTKSPEQILSQRLLQNEVPFILGVTKDEGAFMFAGAILNNKEWTKELDTSWDTVAPLAFGGIVNHVSSKDLPLVIRKLREFYFANSPISEGTRQNLSNLYSDAVVLNGVYRAAVQTKQPVYLYQYAYLGPLSIMGTNSGISYNYDETTIGHMDELPLQFNLAEENDGNLENLEDADFSKNFVRLWTTFATTGKPSWSWGSANTSWTSLHNKQNNGINWYKIGNQPEMIKDPYMDRMAFWEELHKNYWNRSRTERDEL